MHIDFLLKLLKNNKVEHIFGIVDVHKHFDVPSGFHMVTKIEGPQAGKTCLSTQLAQDKDLEPHDLCGYKFAYIPGQGWHPYEFRSGTLLATDKAYSKFISQVSKYLCEHNITSLGLEYTIHQMFGIKVYETVSKTQRRMDLKEFSNLSELPGGVRWVPTCWRSKDTMGPGIFCPLNPDTGKHEDQHRPPKGLENNVYPMSGQLTLGAGNLVVL
jgi:hypothetical protein